MRYRFTIKLPRWKWNTGKVQASLVRRMTPYGVIYQLSSMKRKTVDLVKDGKIRRYVPRPKANKMVNAGWQVAKLPNRHEKSIQAKADFVKNVRDGKPLEDSVKKFSTVQLQALARELDLQVPNRGKREQIAAALLQQIKGTKNPASEVLDSPVKTVSAETNSAPEVKKMDMNTALEATKNIASRYTESEFANDVYRPDVRKAMELSEKAIAGKVSKADLDELANVGRRLNEVFMETQYDFKKAEEGFDYFMHAKFPKLQNLFFDGKRKSFHAAAIAAWEDPSVPEVNKKELKQELSKIKAMHAASVAVRSVVHTAFAAIYAANGQKDQAMEYAQDVHKWMGHLADYPDFVGE